LGKKGKKLMGRVGCIAGEKDHASWTRTGLHEKVCIKNFMKERRNTKRDIALVKK